MARKKAAGAAEMAAKIMSKGQKSSRHSATAGIPQPLPAPLARGSAVPLKFTPTKAAPAKAVRERALKPRRKHPSGKK